MKRRILIVDSNRVFASGLQDLFSQAEYFASDVAHSVEQAEAMIDATHYDVRIVDEDWLNDSAWSIWEELPPAIILTNQKTDNDLDAGALNSGNDIYLAKPFKLTRLLKFLDQIFADDSWQVGSWQFKAQHSCLVRDEKHKELTEKESEILSYLCRAKGKIVKREHLLRDVWGYQRDIDTHTLETHIYRLRLKIEPAMDRPQTLLTAENGYRLDNSAGEHSF